MVSSYVSLLEKRYAGKLDAEADKYIGYAVEGARRMRGLINDLLAYSRAGRREDELRPVESARAVDGARANLSGLIEETGATVKSGELPRVLGNDSQLMQLFQNLVENGIKYRSEAPPAVEISAIRDGPEWTFAVKDNGIGIDPQYSERIFRIFQRLHDRERYSGSGIGLAIAKRIVERHRGRIWVDSSPGAGSTFFFTIPAVDGGLR